MGTAGARLSSSAKWSLAAGGYLFLCAAVLVLLVRQVTSLVAELLALPSASVVLLAVPVPVIGAAVWWGIVERRGRYTYLLGVAVGLVTALVTTLFWILRGALVWDLEIVVASWPLIVIVLVPTVPTGLVAGVPLMYVRRRLDAG